MKMIKTLMMSSTILASMSLLAQTPPPQTATSTPVSTHTTDVPYGDNPNIFKVLGHKAQQTAQSTATKVDQAAQKGIEKIRPKVANVWEETKVLGTETTAVAKEKSQHAAATINQKVNDAKVGIMGSPDQQPAPIVSHPLSQSSTEVTFAPESAPAVQLPSLQNRSMTN
ncbi:hypothetical protein [Acinetobacter albensis]|uniref:Uncharacterized protein n=1 Tax=Acinetobacter albensis TaxID=1673609 RepID=A0A1C4GT54_9GAMM|nr:hypothetical protein [Acinetobacter albensis]SCC71359.1 hypothetical protein GA0116959_103212 [Acinetobacter albensis]